VSTPIIAPRARAFERGPEPAYGPSVPWEDTTHARLTRERIEEMCIGGEEASRVLKLQRALYEAGYILPPDHAVTVTGVIGTENVLMLQGVPGCGKTFFGSCLNQILCPGQSLLKVECHEATSVEDLLFQQDEVSLRLYLETAERTGKDWFALAEEGRSRFVHHGALIQALVSGAELGMRRVVLIDEFDKLRAQAEHLCLSYLNDYSVIVPYLKLHFTPEPGCVPITVVTLNNFREIEYPSQRRCVVLPVDTPTILDEDEILCQAVPTLHTLARYHLLLTAKWIRDGGFMRKPLAISEVIDLAEAINYFRPRHLTPAFFEAHVYYMAKNQRDQYMLRRSIAEAVRYAHEEMERAGRAEEQVYRRLYELNCEQVETRRKLQEEITY
jgi:MoxR-like ATPase